MPDILNAYEDAYNRHDADAVLALFVDKGLTYIETGLAYLYDKAQVRDYLELSFGVGSVVTAIKDCTAEGDTWHCMLLAHDDCYGAYGMIGDSHNELFVKLTDGKLQQLSTAAADDEMKLYYEAVPKFMAWAGQAIQTTGKCLTTRKPARGQSAKRIHGSARPMSPRRSDPR